MGSKLFIISLFLLIDLITACKALCKEAEVMLVDIPGYSLNDVEEIQSACDLLGVRFKIHYVNTTNGAEILKSSRELRDKEVLILPERVLKYLNKDVISLLGQHRGRTKILIWGINSDTKISDLQVWSDHRINNISKFDLQHRAASVRVAENTEISKELGGLEYPLISSGSRKINGFTLEYSARADSLVEIFDERGNPGLSIFVKTESKKRSVFFLTSWAEALGPDANTLIKIMPILMFLKYSFGNRCWHGTQDHANLTIDDPWLREPFGFVSYKALCREAKKALFHVSLGFIPYNYRKSENEAIETFRQCTEALSIAVHGNNHDLSEFRVSKAAPLTHGTTQSIHPDEKNILQALYRMDTHARQTGLSYDRVMIFPRGIFTQESMGLLKRQNFLMTVSRTKPLDAASTLSSIDRMRGITLEYENFPLVLRTGVSDWKRDSHSKAVEKSWIQMRLFLDLPVLLYAHHDYFKDGADAFNSIAGVINQVQPAVAWSDLGRIAKKLYLQRTIGDREIEILAYASDLIIHNSHNVPFNYIIRKQENFLIPIQSVDVDGIKHEYRREGDHIRIDVSIEPGLEKNIRIHYRSQYHIGSFSYTDDNVQATLVRALSDFRDLYVAKLPFGDRVVTILYSVGGLNILVITALTLMGICLILSVWYRKSRRLGKRVHSE